MKDITARGSRDATPTLAPDVSCHRGPVASNAATAGVAAAAATAAPVTRPFFFSTPPPPILPAHPIPQVYGPPSVLFVPVPSYASPFQPFVMTAASTPPPPMPPPEVVVTTDVTPSRQAAPRPARSSTTVSSSRPNDINYKFINKPTAKCEFYWFYACKSTISE